VNLKYFDCRSDSKSKIFLGDLNMIKFFSSMPWILSLSILITFSCKPGRSDSDLDAVFATETAEACTKNEDSSALCSQPLIDRLQGILSAMDASSGHILPSPETMSANVLKHKQELINFYQRDLRRMNKFLDDYSKAANDGGKAIVIRAFATSEANEIVEILAAARDGDKAVISQDNYKAQLVKSLVKQKVLSTDRSIPQPGSIKMDTEKEKFINALTMRGVETRNNIEDMTIRYEIIVACLNSAVTSRDELLECHLPEPRSSMNLTSDPFGQFGSDDHTMGRYSTERPKATRKDILGASAVAVCGTAVVTGLIPLCAVAAIPMLGTAATRGGCHAGQAMGLFKNSKCNEKDPFEISQPLSKPPQGKTSKTQVGPTYGGGQKTFEQSYLGGFAP
jgi:hypothetical protein